MDDRMLKSLIFRILLAFPILAGAAQAQEPTGIVTFTVDNITTYFFDRSMPVFFEHDVPGTMFGQTEPITGVPEEIYWPEIKLMAERGWEFGAHGYSHDKMTEMDDERLELELGGPAAYIFRGTGDYPTSFATPFGDSDARVIERAKIYYDAHVEGWGNDGINRFDSTDHFRINRVHLDNRKSAGEVCGDIEKAGRDGYWLVLMLHRIADEPADEFENSTAQFEAVVKCAADLRDQGIVRLMSVRDALKEVPHTPSVEPERHSRLTPQTYTKKLKGLVSITFDDGTRPQYNYGLRMAREYGLPGTIFIPSGLIRNQIDTPPGSWRMTWEEVREFQAAGWEIGVHGKTHIRLPGLPPEEIEAELAEPIQDIEIRTGTRPVSFSSPFGDFTDESIALIMDRYDYHLSWKGHRGRNPMDGIDPRYIGRLEVTNEMTAATVCGEMVRTAQTGVWLVLLFHGVVDGTPGNYEVKASVYDEILACASYLDRAGIVDVVTVQDAMQAIAAD